MGFLGSIFGSSDSDDRAKAITWIDLVKPEQLDEAIAASHNLPVIIFKHSTRCSVSRMALRQFETHYSVRNARTYFLDLLNFRDISNEIASRLQVVHQSPQIIVLKDGKCIFTESHGEIDAGDVERVIDTAFS